MLDPFAWKTSGIGGAFPKATIALKASIPGAECRSRSSA
jgi:hypothetical protein